LISVGKRLNLAAYSQRTIFRGSYSNRVLSGETRGNLRLDSILLRDRRLIKDASLHLNAKTILSGDRFRIRQGRFQLNKIIAGITGDYKGGKEATLDLTVGIPKFGLEELMSMLPGDAFPARLSFSGNGKLTAVIKGTASGRNNLFIHSGFELSDCTAKNKATRAVISNITLKGSISATRAENFELRLDELTGDLGKGWIKGSFSLSNLKDLLFRADVHAALDLEAIKKFAGPDTVESMKGLILSDFSIAGSFENFSLSPAQALDILEKGTFIFKDAGIKMKNQHWDIRHITGKAAWDKVLHLDSLSLQVNGTSLVASGYLRNLTGYMAQREPIQSNLEISTDHFNLNTFLSSLPKKGSNATTRVSNSLPGIQLKATLRAGTFVTGKFSASDVSLHLTTINDSIYVHDFMLKFPDGTISGDALITESPGHLLSVTCNSLTRTINIQQLFTSFNNFTQKFIVEKNVKGSLSGTISFIAQWDTALKFIPASMKAQANIEITNGELVQFEPMLRLSKYIDVDELRHIRFKTLKNVIFIHDRMITMPEMAIHSTAFNITVSGQHSFDNEFDYRLRVLLSEVLFNKARKKKQEINEFLVEETPSDQTIIPLIIAGRPDQFDVRFDRRRAFDLTRKNLKEEASGSERLPSRNDFRIEWEEPDSGTVQLNQPPSGKQDGSDFEVEWNEEDTGNE
jgi:hypothetical protein